MIAPNEDFFSDLDSSAKSLEAMATYMRTVQRVANDLVTLSQYFNDDTIIGCRMRDLLHEMSQDIDCISDTASKAANSSIG